jgi:hypothetical protein
MANVVKLKRSAVSGKNPTTSDLQLGEVALNTYDGNLFFKKDTTADSDGSESIVTVVTTDGNQTLSGKSLSSPVLNDPSIRGTTTVISSNTTTSPFVFEATGLNSDVNLIDIDSSSPLIYINDHDGGAAYTTHANQGTSSVRYGRDANDDFFIGVSTDGSTWVDDAVKVDHDTADVHISGNLVLDTNAKNIDLSSGAGIIDDQNSDGSSGQILISTGQGVRWQTNSSGNLSGLGDISFSGLESGQIIKYNGTVWVNADEQAVVTSAVFAANATTDLGPLSDENISFTEDLEPEHETEDQPNGMGDTNAYYNMGSLAIDGVVGLRNVDQSLKSDYISYSIIFGF